jgi:hypothetical protein
MATGTLTDIGNAVSAVFAQSMSVDRLGWQKVNQWHPDVSEDLWGDTYQVIIDEGMKLIQADRPGRAPVYALYDLTKDPDETADLAASDPDRVAKLAAALEAWRKGQPAYDAGKRTEADSPREETESEKAALEQLGYLSEEDAPEGEPQGSGAEEPAPEGSAGEHATPGDGAKAAKAKGGKAKAR